VNLNEASSVIAALPLFIESEFLISAKTFCRTTFIEAAKSGQWVPDTRVFLSQEDLAMDAMLEQIVELADTPPADVIISSDHQRPMAMTEDDANTLATDLRNKAPAPLEKDGDDMSALTVSTRTSKADRIADERVLAVSKEHQLALAEARQEQQLMKEDFKRRFATLLAATNAAPSAIALTPESAAPPASSDTETNNNTTRNIQNNLSANAKPV